MGRILLILLAILGIGTQARAQPEHPAPANTLRESLETAALRALYASTPAVQTFDVVTTLRALDAGAREGNPLMSTIASNRPAFAALKLGVAASEIYSAHALAGRSRLAAIGVLVGVNAGLTLLAMRNLNIARQASRYAPAHP